MVNPLMGKLFGSMVEQRTSSWVEVREKGKKDKQPLDLNTLPLTTVSPLDI